MGRDRQREARKSKNKEGYIQREGGLEKEEETMGSCSSRDSDEMMMLKASVEKERLDRSRHKSSSSRSSSSRRSRSRSRSRRRSRSRESSSRREGSKRRSRSREREKSRHRSSSTFSSRSSTGHDDRDKNTPTSSKEVILA